MKSLASVGTACALLLVVSAACGTDPVGSAGGQTEGKNGKPKGSGQDGGGLGGGFGSADAAALGTGDAAGLLDDDAGKVDDDDCGHASIDTTVEKTEVPGNILVVYDKSGSMREAWNLPDGTASTKLIAAGKAFIDALVPTAAKVNVGTIFFPSSGSCDVAELSSGEQIAMQNGVDYLNAWTAYWQPPRDAGGNTPLLAGLQRADTALSDPTFATTFPGTTVVIVITDGDPNCSWDAPTANALVAKWLTTGIETYVIGLPGLSGDGLALLTDLAVAGGTTDFYNTTDSATLQMQLAKITSETVSTKLDSCKIKLDPPPPSADKVVMVAEEKGQKLSVPRVINADAGWTINAAGTQVELTGLLCRDAQNGRFTKITLEYGCVNLPPIEPPRPQ